MLFQRGLFYSNDTQCFMPDVENNMVKTSTKKEHL